ncbi:MAG: MOSC domain-containing protein [Campylobacterota bacterium]|nr:MOSC domain-containing protein [Campylobacterota bacterium]
MTGKVLKLFTTLNDENKTRKTMQKISVDPAGIINDKFYDKNPMRSILLTSQDSYDLSQKNGIDLEAGVLGENILIDINPYSLVNGDRITIGNTELEITQPCTLCKGLTTVNSKLPKLLKNDRGIFAKVIKGNSEIEIGDKVEILNY